MSAQPIWREPSAEHRAAATVHTVGHSVGFVVTATDPSPGVRGTYEFPFSFRVSGAGVEECLGWGVAGPTIDLQGYPNPPANMLTVHTVLVTVDDEGGEEELASVRQAIRQLVDEHLERYHECAVFPARDVREPLAEWLKAGCPQEAAEDAPDETLADAQT